MDGNITSAIVAAILMLFGSGPMLSLGYTLLAGIIINVVTVSYTHLDVYKRKALYGRRR